MNINRYQLALALIVKSQWAALLAEATHWASEPRLPLESPVDADEETFFCEKMVFLSKM